MSISFTKLQISTEYYQQLAVKNDQRREIKHYFCHLQEGKSWGKTAGMFLNCLYWRSKIYLFSLLVWEDDQAPCQQTEYCSMIAGLSSLIGMKQSYPGLAWPSLAWLQCSRHHIPSLICYLQHGDINLIPWSPVISGLTSSFTPSQLHTPPFWLW